MLEGKYKKNRVPKIAKLTPSRNMSKQKQSENARKGTQKKRVEIKMKRNKKRRPK